MSCPRGRSSTKSLFTFMSNSISQTLRIFVDEAGSLDVKPASESTSCRVIIVCAVAVPPLQEESVLSLLPRDHNGNFLKSSDKLMSDNHALALCKTYWIARPNVSL